DPYTFGVGVGAERRIEVAAGLGQRFELDFELVRVQHDLRDALRHVESDRDLAGEPRLVEMGHDREVVPARYHVPREPGRVAAHAQGDAFTMWAGSVRDSRAPNS